MDPITELLQKHGVTYEELNYAERETLKMWEVALTSNDLKTEKILEFLDEQIFSVGVQLSAPDLGVNVDCFLKLRLKDLKSLKKLVAETKTVALLKERVQKAKEEIEAALTVITLNADLDLHYKAQLKNLNILMSMLVSPEKAKKTIDLMIRNLASVTPNKAELPKNIGGKGLD